MRPRIGLGLCVAGMLAWCAGLPAEEAGSGPGVVVVFLDGAPPRDVRLTLHVESPGGERFETPFAPVTRAQLAARPVRMERRRDPAASPSPVAGSMAGSAHSRSAHEPEPPRTPSPSPMAGSDHAHSGSSRDAPSPGATPASLTDRRRESPGAASPKAGSDHAHSGTARSPAPPGASSPPPAHERRLGPHRVLVVVRMRPDDPVPAARGAPYFATMAAPLDSFEGAVVLSGMGDPVNLRIQYP